MLNPYYVVGFVDGEGCFCVSICQRRYKVPEVRLKFEIELREDDEPILKEIQNLMQCGAIYRLDYKRYQKWQPHVKFAVGSFKDIREKIIPFFQKYPLQAKKRKQFDFFCQIADLMALKVHTTEEGVKQILLLREEFRNS